jgi:hypothetical protein
MKTTLEKHLKEVKLQNRKIVNSLVQSELNKIFREDYYGSKEQILNEKVISENVLVKENCEMKYNETIEEWYLRIYDFTK